jgi:hypothetical protein
LTNRRSETITKALVSIFGEMGVPREIHCDNEFATGEFNKLAIKYNIHFIFSEAYDEQKNSIVERFNGTLAKMYQKYRQGQRKYNWPKVLNEVIENYNSTYHSTIKATPYDIWHGKDINSQIVKVVKPEFQVGDMVRIKIKKSIFDKGDELRYSTEVFKIIKIEKGRFLLNDEKLYTAKKLKKVNDSMENPVEEEDEEEENEEEQIHNQTQKRRRVNRKLKQVGISEDNIVVEPKRVRKHKTILDM